MSMSIEELREACRVKVTEVAAKFKEDVPEITDEKIVAAVGNYFAQRWHNYRSNDKRRKLVAAVLEKAKELGISLEPSAEGNDGGPEAS